MSDPRHAIDRRIPASPETVLAAIRDAIPAAQASDVPPALRRRLVPVMRGRVHRQRFSAHLNTRSEESYDLAGYVLPAEGGGSRVVADVRGDRHPERMPLAPLAAAAVMAIAGLGGAVYLAVAAAVAWAIGAAGQRLERVPEREAEFLLSWLDRVLDGLPAGPGDAAGTGDEPFPSPAASQR